MSAILDWMNPMRWLMAAALLASLLAGGALLVHRYDAAQQKIGADEVHVLWSAETKKLQAAALAEATTNAKETLRRQERQQENQNAQNTQLAQARSDAARNAAGADQLRQQQADTAHQWSAALRDSPTVAVRQAAGAAIGLQADMLGRLDSAAVGLAEYADAARAAGSKCERDYSSLTGP